MNFTYAHISENTVVGLYEYTNAVDADDLILLNGDIQVAIGDSYFEGVFSSHSQVKAVENITKPLIPAVIEDVTGTVAGFSDVKNQYTVFEGEQFIASGTLAIIDQKFLVPFKRIDTGRTQLMLAEVKDGKLTLTMNFKTGGMWVVNNELINAELDEPKFSIEEYRFAVI
ncbi:hypothetical protein SG34_025665 [Thalassomonas viridans]|uniref:Uncharacterized protein n=1 Tax=Thalassomonas viridans TaxID=137584 RepID=A0AAF0C8F0_9GAMM|nr:hypothetical protein [Thalassomonas viridans]WDE04678.1 hypothetical protein SG34_025665 [Thalassomonas viridans]